jgi:hypothetical protein
MSEPVVAPARDLAAVAGLMNAHWPRPCWRYSAQLLESYLRRPGARAEWLLELRIDDALHGFMAAAPWHGRLGREIVDAAYTSFLTVSPQAAAWGGGPRLIGAMLATLRADGVQHYLTAFEAGRPETRLIERVHARNGVTLIGIAPIRRWLGTPRVLAHAFAQRTRVPIEPVTAADLADCAALLAANAPPGLVATMPDVATLARLLPADADPSSLARLWRVDGRLVGLLLARQRDVLDHRPRHNLHVDWITVAAAQRAQAADFLATFLAAALDVARSPEIDVVVVQDPADQHAGLLGDATFLRTSQQMKLCWGALVPHLAPPDVRGAGAFEVF